MPDDPAVHRYMLAYASDFNLVPTSLYPHGHSYWQPEMQVASLDHAMWFHRDFRLDQWLLYAMSSPSAGKARGLSLGRIYSADGRLVASVAQEGLIRYHGKPASDAAKTT
jgi:acyl-CoA thioesterase-2